ncbi:MAG: winged helix-turn-helix domain-containing protein [Alphaproteobacteria bacterium]
MRILVIEDDKEAASYMVKGLSEHGHVADHVHDAESGLVMAESGYDVIVLDRMLPGMDGLQAAQNLRGNGFTTPILFLSALGEVDDRVTGLKAGGDDYLVKPFAFSELLARLEALARRRGEEPQTEILIGDLEINLLSRRVTRGGQRIELQPREFKLLEFLARHSDRVVTRTMLLENVWEYNFDPQTNVIDVHVSRLRSKIDKGFQLPLLHTVRGAGYRLSEKG